MHPRSCANRDRLLFDRTHRIPKRFIRNGRVHRKFQGYVRRLAGFPNESQRKLLVTFFFTFEKVLFFFRKTEQGIGSISDLERRVKFIETRWKTAVSDTKRQKMRQENLVP